MNSRALVMSALGLAVLASVASACATTSVRTDYDRGTDFDRYRTYVIRRGPLTRESDVDHVPETVVRERIHGALANELSGRGITPAMKAMPDIVVTYAVTARREQELVETISNNPNWNYGGYNVFPRDVDRGTLVIDVIDARAGKLVWRSIAAAENEEVRSAGFIERAVEKAMKKFPPGVS